MRVLVGCEYSQIVTKAFRKKGHDAWSCDILPTEGDPQYHRQTDIVKVVREGWDVGIFHPPCTFLTNAANNSFRGDPRRWVARLDAVMFVWELWNSNIEKIAIENPIGVLSSYIGKPTQIIQPYEFGHLESKQTCLWLKNLPLLIETNNVKDEMDRLPKSQSHKVHHATPSDDRWKIRSLTYPGISEAMAEQWG
jgi:hypothetical protein